MSVCWVVHVAGMVGVSVERDKTENASHLEEACASVWPLKEEREQSCHVARRREGNISGWCLKPLRPFAWRGKFQIPDENKQAIIGAFVVGFPLGLACVFRRLLAGVPG